jgi:hypothetical protein
MIERVIGNPGLQDIQVIESIPAQQTSRSHISTRNEHIVRNVGLNNPTNWIGGLNTLQLITAAQAQQAKLLTTKGSGTATVADYHTGSAARPVDANWVRNAGEAASIPAIRPFEADGQTIKSWSDRGDRLRFERDLMTERDFLEASIADNAISYDDFVREDEGGRTTLRSATRDVQTGAEEIYRQMISRDPGLKNEPVTFVMTGSQIAVGNGVQFPNPQTQHWKDAVGSHQIWMSATVTVAPGDNPNDPPRFSMRMMLHAEKSLAMEDDSSDDLGLEAVYSSFATLERDVSWMEGHPEAAVSKPVSNYRRV